MTNQLPAPRGAILRGFINAIVIIVIAVALKLLSPNYITPNLATRLLGVLLGAVVVIYANAVPKALSPLIRMRCDPVAEQAMRRFTGWSLALGGLGYAVAWFVAPIGSANTIAVCLLGASVLLVLTRLVLRGTSKQSRA
jgi:hypothetical protein